MTRTPERLPSVLIWAVLVIGCTSRHEAKAPLGSLSTPPVLALRDGDMDGVDDATDLCPLEAEDVDSFRDGDGCPDLDNDADGILDVNDGVVDWTGVFYDCRNQAEDFDGNCDEDGCPEPMIFRWDLPINPLGYHLTKYSLKGDLLDEEMAAAVAVASWMAANPWMHFSIVVARRGGATDVAAGRETQTVGERLLSAIVRAGGAQQRIEVVAMGNYSGIDTLYSVQFLINTDKSRCPGFAPPPWTIPGLLK